MMKCGVISALLCAFLMGIDALGPMTLSRSPSMPSTNIAPVDNGFYLVSRKDNTIKLRKNGNETECSVSWKDSDKHYMRGQISAAILEQGNVIVSGLQLNKNENHVSKHSFIFSVIDYKNCRMVETFILDSEVKENVVLEATVFGYKDTFDIFLPGKSSCNPCRYDHNGKKIKLDVQLPEAPLEAEITTPNDHHIQVFMNVNYYVSGYTIAYNLKNGSSLVRVLKSDFKIHQSHVYDKPIQTIATTYGMYPRIGLCFQPSNNKYTCSILDGQMEIEWSMDIPFQQGHQEQLKLFLDLQGHMYATVKGNSNTREHEKIKVYYERKRYRVRELKEISYNQHVFRVSAFYGFIQRPHHFCVVTTYEDMTYDNVTAYKICRDVLGPNS